MFQEDLIQKPILKFSLSPNELKRYIKVSTQNKKLPFLFEKEIRRGQETRLKKILLNEATAEETAELEELKNIIARELQRHDVVQVIFE